MESQENEKKTFEKDFTSTQAKENALVLMKVPFQYVMIKKMKSN